MRNLLSRRAGLAAFGALAGVGDDGGVATENSGDPGQSERRGGSPADEWRYRALVEHSSDMFFLSSSRGVLQFLNPAVTRTLGYTSDELMGKSCFEIIHPDEIAVVSEVLFSFAGQPGASRALQCRVLTKQGEWRWLEGVGTNLLHEPNVRAIVVSARDITARKRTETERAVFFDVIRALNSIPDLDELMAQIHASLKRIVYAENCFVALFDEDANLFHYPFFVDQFDSKPAPRALGRGLADHVFRTGQPLLFQTRNLAELCASGEFEPLEPPAPAWLGVPLRAPNGTIGVLAVQHYADEDAYDQHDLDLLNSIGGQIALALERKRVEQNLQKQQHEREIIFQAAPAMIWYKDAHNRILRANRAAAQSLGMEVHELEGKSLFDLFPAEAVRYHQDDLEVIRTGEAKLGIVEPYRLPSGEVRIVCTDKIPYRAEDGRVTGVVAFSADITERQRALEAVRRSEVNYRSMVEGAPYGICRVSAQGRLFNANPSLIEMLGFQSEKDLLDINLDRDIFREPGARSQIVAEHGEIFEGVEVSWNRKDGVVIQVRLSGRPVTDPEWPSTCYEIVAENVSEHRILERQLRQAQKMEAVGRLAGGVAHDFNNLLTVIQGHTELMLDRARGDAWWAHKVEQVQKAAERAARLTRQLLSFSRTQVLQPKLIDLNEIVMEMGKMLPRLIGEDIELRIVEASAPSHVKADPGQIEQVLMNLAVNARDAMPTGGVLSIETFFETVDDVYSRYHPEIDPGEYVVLRVSDIGVGMDAETQAHIFEPFFTTKPIGKGTGLGLAIVYGVIKQSGGHIHVSSELRKGTTFEIFLPRTDEQVDVGGAAVVQEYGRPGMGTILLAEDERGVREVAREFLSLSGYTVLEASDGEEALEIARRHEEPIHLLLTDVIMPRLGGRELADHICTLRPETRVMYMSGYTEHSSLSARDLGENASFLSKPFTRISLTQAVADALKSRRAR